MSTPSTHNPYDPPATDTVQRAPSLEQERRAHLGAEGRVRAVGWLFTLFGGLNALTGVFSILVAPVGVPWAMRLLALRSLAYLASGVLLLRHRRAGRTLLTATVGMTVVWTAGVVGLQTRGGDTMADYVGFALRGLLFPVPLCALLWSKQVTAVLTKRYRDEVIPASPGLRPPKWPVFLPIVLFVALILAFAVLYALVEDTGLL